MLSSAASTSPSKGPVYSADDIDFSGTAVRAYTSKDVHSQRYDGPRVMISLPSIIEKAGANIRSEQTADHQHLMQALSEIEALKSSNLQLQQLTASQQSALTAAQQSIAQAQASMVSMSSAMAQLQAQGRQIIISTTPPSNPSAGLIWIEETAAGLPKYNWIRRDNKWFSLEPLYTSYGSGVINALLNQQLPLNLPCGCNSIYFDGFQATVYITSKLLTGVGYIITPQYLDWQGNLQSFPNNPNINTQSYPANSTQVLNPLNLATTMTLAQVSALHVNIGPVGIPGAIRMNCSFRYYGIRA